MSFGVCNTAPVPCIPGWTGTPDGASRSRAMAAPRLTMILVMTVQTPEKAPSRKQRLQEKQRRQLLAVDIVDKAEIKVHKAESELAVAVTEAVRVFGDEQSASEGLDMPIEAIHRFLTMAREAGAEPAEAGADTP